MIESDTYSKDCAMHSVAP